MRRQFSDLGGQKKGTIAVNLNDFTSDVFLRVLQEGVERRKLVGAPPEELLTTSSLAASPFISPCPEWEDELTAAYTGDLSSTEYDALDRHLRSCLTCRTVRTLDKRIADLICSSSIHTPIQPALEVKISRPLQRIKESQRIQEPTAVQAILSAHLLYKLGKPSREAAYRQPLRISAQRRQKKARNPIVTRSERKVGQLLTLVVSIVLITVSAFYGVGVLAWASAISPVGASMATAPRQIHTSRAVTPMPTIPALQPSPTPGLDVSPYADSPTLKQLEQEGSLAMSDPLLDNSKGYRWKEYNTSGLACEFVRGTYHSLVKLRGFVAECPAQNSKFANIVFQVQMTIIQGDGGGLIFRSEGVGSAMYRFRVSQDGTYDLYLSFSGGGDGRIMASGFSSAIDRGLHQTNLLTATAIGSNIDLYVNGNHIANLSNSTLSSGEIGLFAFDSTLPTDVAFSSVQVWEL